MSLAGRSSEQPGSAGGLLVSLDGADEDVQGADPQEGGARRLRSLPHAPPKSGASPSAALCVDNLLTLRQTTSDGFTIPEKAVIEHNMAATGRIYDNIRIAELGNILLLDANRVEKVTLNLLIVWLALTSPSDGCDDDHGESTEGVHRPDR